MSAQRWRLFESFLIHFVVYFLIHLSTSHSAFDPHDPIQTLFSFCSGPKDPLQLSSLLVLFVVHSLDWLIVWNCRIWLLASLFLYYSLLLFFHSSLFYFWFLLWSLLSSFIVFSWFLYSHNEFVDYSSHFSLLLLMYLYILWTLPGRFIVVVFLGQFFFLNSLNSFLKWLLIEPYITF